MASNLRLGTMLRHLIEHLDGSVEQHYWLAGLAYKPRYTPIVRALIQLQRASLQEISQHAQITHSAVSQTIAEMRRAGLIESAEGKDGRQRVVRLSAKANRMLPKLQKIWRATNAAADRLDAELPFPLSSLLAETIAALEKRSFEKRIRDTRVRSKRSA